MTYDARWLDPNPHPSPVVGFTAHYSDDCATWALPLDVGMPAPDDGGVYSATVPTPAMMTCIAVTARDGAGLVSGYSNSRPLPEASGTAMLLAGCLLLSIAARRREST